MKRILILAGWATLTGVILSLALREEQGLFWGQPPITLAFGMIGVALCHYARQRAFAAQAVSGNNKA